MSDIRTTPSVTPQNSPILLTPPVSRRAHGLGSYLREPRQAAGGEIIVEEAGRLSVSTCHTTGVDLDRHGTPKSQGPAMRGTSSLAGGTDNTVDGGSWCVGGHWARLRLRELAPPLLGIRLRTHEGDSSSHLSRTLCMVGQERSAPMGGPMIKFSPDVAFPDRATIRSARICASRAADQAATHEYALLQRPIIYAEWRPEAGIRRQPGAESTSCIPSAGETRARSCFELAHRGLPPGCEAFPASEPRGIDWRASRSCS